MDKKRVFEACVLLVRGKIEEHQRILKDIHESSSADTKSSAGDKFETSREMLKQEAEKAKTQLQILLKQKNELNSLKPITKMTSVDHGSLVFTNHGTMYISSALGKVKVGTENVFAISKMSPMAKELRGKKSNHSVTVNGRLITIRDVS